LANVVHHQQPQIHHRSVWTAVTPAAAHHLLRCGTRPQRAITCSRMLSRRRKAAGPPRRSSRSIRRLRSSALLRGAVVCLSRQK
jgi:hypothetical protein